ncbi:MAG: iron-sulfur cluster assembly protein [Chloroflexi bacterium]|nr:iron-sulfur cluster assembly protein [Chloroflexota bacterium]
MVKDDIIEMLRNIQDPELERNIVDLDFIAGVDVQDNKAVVHFQPDTLTCPFLDVFVAEIKQAALHVKGITEVDVMLKPAPEFVTPDKRDLPVGGIDHLNHAKKVIAVISGKLIFRFLHDCPLMQALQCTAIRAR